MAKPMGIVSKSRVGEKYGRLTVLSQRMDGTVNRSLCKCECGGIKEVRTSNIVSLSVVSCGCRRNRVSENGLNWEQYREMTAGADPSRTPLQRYHQQRFAAKRRGVEWKFTPWEWWLVWKESGLFYMRGRGGRDYVMCRNGDSGAYEAGNVFIDLAVNNSSSAPHHRSGLPIGVRKNVGSTYYVQRTVNGKRTTLSGKFQTPEAAAAAWEL